MEHPSVDPRTGGQVGLSSDAPSGGGISVWQRMMAAVTETAANLAPYKIFKQGDEWVVKNNAGMVKARFSDRAAALKYLRALYANVPGAPKKADKTKWTGTAPKPKAAAK